MEVASSRFCGKCGALVSTVRQSPQTTAMVVRQHGTPVCSGSGTEGLLIKHPIGHRCAECIGIEAAIIHDNT